MRLVLHKTLKKIFSLTLVTYLLFPVVVFSQMNVAPSASATSLAQAIAGNGVTISNAAINCGSNAAGTFTYVGSNLGMTGGIILSTGTASNASNAGSYLCNVNNGNTFSDPDLTGIVATANLDVCLLQFDFVPICNNLNMTYVFGSEEYPQAVNLQYNDAFAIFLTGPNPSGGNYSAQNIAALPNGTAVSIHNVNATSNSAYFHNNYSNPNSDVAYNGYTIPVTSVTPVIPCSTYHMKIAIADAGNALYDSGVFIADNSISCQNTPVLTASTTPTSCGNTGSATVSVSNYTGTPTYHWLPGGQTTSSINNLGAGTYTCTVHFQQACGTLIQTITATVNTVGNNMVLTSTQQTLTCNGGNNASATVTAIGGTSPYTCVWNTNPVQNGSTASNLYAGTYTATVTDNAGCQSNVQVNIIAPPVMHLGISTSPATCTGSTGTASVSVTSNGTAPFTYSWNTNPVQNTQTASNIPQGVYIVIITDAHNCSVNGTATVNTQTPSWTLALSTPTNVSCYGGNNGAVSIIVNNPGNSTFTYSWNTSPQQNSQSAGNLSAGIYSCTVVDNNGCILSTSANVSQPNLLTATLNTSPTMCAGSVGSIVVSAVGGTPPYTYTWSAMPGQTSNLAQGLSQGQYTITIADAHNCSTSAMGNVGVTNPTLQINQSVSNSICGGPSGSINILSVSPNSPPYTYSWYTGQNTSSINHLSPGIYVVNVTDKNGCTGSSPATVNIDPTLPVKLNTVSDLCNQGHGSASITAYGNPPYQYVWNTIPAQTSQTVNNLSAGNYFVLVTDAYNCKDSVAVTVQNQNDLFDPAFLTMPTSDLNAEEPITISMHVNTGWTLSNGYLSDGTTINNLNFEHVFAQSGDYSATYYFTSTHGCKDSVTYEMHVKDYMTLYIPNSFSPNGDGLNDVFEVKGTLIRSFELFIYDRWDNLVAKLEDQNENWNGKCKGQEAEIGTYVYKGRVIDSFGKENYFKGQINLIR